MADLEGLYNQLDAKARKAFGANHLTGVWPKAASKATIERWLQVHDQTRDAVLVELQAENKRLRAESDELRRAVLKYRDRVRYGLRHGYDDRINWLHDEALALRIALGEELVR